ncbi:MAG: hypothetical protein MUO34_07325, partial [Ignavibacteriaceae bacterium]|nr:hypothetical protein [Ignavibacteriaceae bacterium]
LDYKNIFKIGRAITIKTDDFELETFFNADTNIGLRKSVDTKQFIYALDKNIIEILESQNYEALISYAFREVEDLAVIISDNSFYSINNDGSVLGIVDIDALKI